ncbi:ribonuclease domain-containing protein [Gordonia sp. ABSL11-1]|uniref:ribonuclease domain-containing protein n=1 Tax=Gordonia sp. ABSL11-1 TaxID=3053924 RepID=UPI002573A3C2|nr:ribonuclease domain-containing protein [Gordonia sp. ABSL11-1]MDL9946682.1 ribonuclease domain-containing protein [Gordonia sp. ABSL11-1]
MADGTARTRRQAIVSAVAVVVVAVVAGVVAGVVWLLGEDSGTDTGDAAHASAASSTTVAPGPAASTRAAAPNSSSTAAVPAHVRTTLALIDAGDWPAAAHAPGTRGGTVFRNNERNLPVTGSDGRRVSYREWDVNAKEPGRSRDAERIVTGSDGTAWYTDDHYRTFVRIRGPNR